MPTLHVELFTGRSDEQKRQLVSELTMTTCRVLGCEASAVDIVLIEVEKKNWASAGKLWSDNN